MLIWAITALAIESKYGAVWLTTPVSNSSLWLIVIRNIMIGMKLNSDYEGEVFDDKYSNVAPYMLSPPVPSPRVKSPPWHMNPGMTRWKTLPR